MAPRKTRSGDGPPRAAARTGRDGRWQTALTSIAPNKILIRGYPVDEMMGRLSFAEAVYLLLMGELPTPAIGRMFNAILVSSLDHGVTPAVDARRAQRRDVGRADEGLRGGGRARRSDRIMAATSNRACGFSTRGLAMVRGGKTAAGGGERARRGVPRSSIRRRPGSGIGSTRAIRARRGCFRWRWSSSSRASTCGCCARSSGRSTRGRTRSAGRCR